MTTTARGRRASSQRKGDATERAILETTERLLASTSLAEVSVQAIARGAGISRPSFYFYFASKEDVLLALVDRATGWLEEQVVAATAAIPRGAEEGITAGMQATARLWDEHGPVLRAAAETAAVDARVRAAWDATLRRFVAVNAAMIAAERERGAAPAGSASPEELATALVLLNERAFHAAAAGGDVALGPARIVPVLTEVWRRAIFEGRAS